MRNGFCWQYYPIWTLVEKVAITTPLKCILLKNDGWTTTFLLLEGICSGDLLNCRSVFGMFFGMFPCFICFSSAIFNCRTRCSPKVLDCFYKQESCWNNWKTAIMIEMCCSKCESSLEDDFAECFPWVNRGEAAAVGLGMPPWAFKKTFLPPKLEALVAKKIPAFSKLTD